MIKILQKQISEKKVVNKKQYLSDSDDSDIKI
jgi:hypothetical protein